MIIAQRYHPLVNTYLERGAPWRTPGDSAPLRLYGLPVEFSPDPTADPQWAVINFTLEKEPGVPVRYPYFRLFD